MRKVKVQRVGDCPIQNKRYSVDVTYIDCTTNEDPVPVYEKGSFACEYRKQGNACNIKCPIAAIAPQTINHV